jgi:cytochrome b561
MKTQKYPHFMIALHWLTFILVVIVAYMGFQLENYEFNEANFSHFRTHALLGALIMIITLIRMYYKRKNLDKIPQIDYYSEGHKKMVNGVHLLMYLLLILIPITGLINIYQTGTFGVCFGKTFPQGAQLSDSLHEIHESLVYFLFVLIAAHVGGVFVYMMKTKENLLKRMCILAK